MIKTIKRHISIMLAFICLLAFATPQSLAQNGVQTNGPILSEQDMQNVQAAWMATVYNIDFPSVKSDPQAQMNEFDDKLDSLKALGINTIVVQVRPSADALYESVYNPWSAVLTGAQGEYPGYDPLAYMIESAHSRGMALHAWLNPYRVTTSGTDVSTLARTHSARRNPDWLITDGDALYYNPEKDGVKNHIVNTVYELIANYDVDGLVFDDYFYPSHYPLPEGEDRDGPTANARREHVNDMIMRVHTIIEMTHPDILFGVSPAGIWKNDTSDVTGATAGNEAYYSVCADARTWIQNEWVDYISPQIYWSIGTQAADYETLVKWWANEVSGTSVKLWISQAVYRESVASQMDQQLEINGKYPEVTGSMYYNVSHLLGDTGSCQSKIASYNSAKVAENMSQ
jgi:uncharacterized lipoprotein YddW (UPF0748 family)